MSKSRRIIGKAGRRILGKHYRKMRLPLKQIMPLSIPESKAPSRPNQASSRSVASKNVTKKAGKGANNSSESSTLAIGILKLVFQSDFYESQTGRTFSSKSEAIEHFLKYGMKARRSPNFLIAFDYLDQELRQKYIKGDLEAFANFLTSGSSVTRPISPFVDFRNLPESERPNSALDFLLSMGKKSTITPSDTLAVGQNISFETARSIMCSHAQEICRQEFLHVDSTSPTWNHEAEHLWIDDVLSRSTILDSSSNSKIPLVSIVMPVWNRSEQVLRAIDSIQNQSLTNWELVVVDDGSTDSTVDVIKSVIESDSRISLVERMHEGVCAARNAGIDGSKSDYVAFLDSDNVWPEEFLRISLTEIMGRGLSCVFSAIEMNGANGEVKYLGKNFTAEQLLIRNYVDMNTLIVRRELLDQIGGFDLTLRRMVDHDLIIRISRISSIVFLPYIGCHYQDDSSTERISTQESVNWQFAAIGRNLVDWPLQQGLLSSRDSEKVSIVIPMWQDAKATLRTVKSILRSSDGIDFEIVILDNASQRASSMEIFSATISDSRIRVIRLRRNYGYAISANIGFSESTGNRIIFLQPGMEIRTGFIAQLVDQLKFQDIVACQPVILEPNGVICNAGYISAASNGIPVRFLEGLPVQDARRKSVLDITAFASEAFIVGAEDFVSVQGFEPLFNQGLEDADLSLRLSRLNERRIVCVTDAIAVRTSKCEPARNKNRWQENNDIFMERWSAHLRIDSESALAQVSMRMNHIQPGNLVEGVRDSLSIARQSARGISQVIEGRPSLRWSIKIGASFTEGQDRWGDVFFADDLATSLRKIGQEVVIDRFGAFDRASSYLDDVTLTIRGFQPFRPQTGKLNMLWVISRPDEIKAKEIRRFDSVFAASKKWAQEMTKQSGVPVQLLLQATNPERFNPGSRLVHEPTDLVFVGGPRPPLGRKIIDDAMRHGVDVKVWGPRWANFVPEELVVGEFLDNDDASGVYRSARLLLNDHFQDMAENGFVNNRLFDAVASGARVVSDYVPEIDKLFKGAVQVYRTPQELLQLTGPNALDYFPSDDEMASIGRDVRTNHSFDARAEVLLDDAISRLGRQRRRDDGSTLIDGSESGTFG